MIVKDSKKFSDQDIMHLFNNIKRNFNDTIKDEDKKAFFILLSDLCCKDLIRRGNPIKNRKDRDSTEGATQIDMNGRCPV